MIDMEKVHPRSFIYGLVDPETRLVFYVGQSTTGMKRPREHGGKGWRYEITILEVVADPKGPSIGACHWIAPGMQQTALNEAERYWIAFGRACGGRDCNGLRFRGFVPDPA